MKRFLLYVIVVLLAFGAGVVSKFSESGRGGPASSPTLIPVAQAQPAAVVSPGPVPARTLEEALAHPSMADEVLAVADLIERTPVDKLPAILDAAALMPQHAERASVVELVFGKWAKMDPVAALAYARSKERDLFSKNAAMASSYSTWASRDPHAALDDAIKHNGFVNEVLKAWSSTAPKEAMAEFEKLSNQQKSDAYVPLFYNFALADLPGALAKARALSDVNRQQEVLRQIYALWMASDPAGAEKYLDGLPQGKDKDMDEFIKYLNLVRKPEKVISLEPAADDQSDPPRRSSEFFIWASHDLTASLNAALKLTKPNDRTLALRGVFTYWARKDQPAAIAATSRLSAADAQSTAYFAIADQFSDRDPAGAFAFLEKYVGPFKSESDLPEMRRLIEWWTEHDPKAVLQALERHPELPANYPVGAYQYVSWWCQEPGTAWTAATAITDIKLRNQSLNAIVSWMGWTDGPRAVDLLEHDTGKVYQNDTWRNVFEHWAEVNPPAALQRAFALQDAGRRQGAAGIVYGRWAWKASTEVAATFEQIPDRVLAAELYPQFAEILRNFDLKTAWEFSYKNSTKPPPFQLDREWANADARAAAAKAKSLPPGASRDQLLEAVAGEWANSDPRAVLDWANTLANLSEKDKIRQIAISKLVHFDPVASASMLDWFSTGQERDDMTEKIAYAWANFDAPAAFQWAIEKGDLAKLPFEQDVVRLNTFLNILRRDPTGCAMVVAGMGDRVLRDSLVPWAAKIWANEDPAGAINWLMSLPNSLAREDALRKCLTTWGLSNPSAAFRWVVTRPESAERTAYLKQVIQLWANGDSVSASRELSSSGLPQVQVAQLQQDIKDATPRTPATPHEVDLPFKPPMRFD